MHVSIVLLIVAATVGAASTSGIPCNLGNIYNHKVVNGFKTCVSIYDFRTDNTLMSGRREESTAPSTDDQVPGFNTIRTQQCQVKPHRGSVQLHCTCWTPTCNSAVTPMKLIEEMFEKI